MNAIPRPLPSDQPRMTMPDFELIASHHVLAFHLGVAGNLFGGTLLSWIDEAAVLCADRVALNTFVTFEMDKVRFLRPCKLAEVVEISARVSGRRTSSLEIELKAEHVNRSEGTRELVLTTRAVMVAVDAEGRKTPLRWVGP